MPGRDHKIISIPPSDDGEYAVSPLHARSSTEMYAHALANITSTTATPSPSTSTSPSPSPSAPSLSKIVPAPSSNLTKHDSSTSSAIICGCSICQDAIGNHTNESKCDAAARMLRMMNRSFVGEAIKFITTVALAFLIGYYALKSQMSELKDQVIDLRTQVDAANTQLQQQLTTVNAQLQQQLSTANTQLTDQVAKARTDIQAQVATSTSGLDSRLTSTSIAIDSLTTVLKTFPDAATINATIDRVNNLNLVHLSQQVTGIRQDVNILTHDTEILHSNISNWTSHLHQTEWLTSQHLNNVTSQYMDVSKQLASALVHTSQQYDIMMMDMNTTASAHLQSLHELHENSTITLRNMRDDITSMIHDIANNETQHMSQFHANILSQLQQFNRTIINDVINQHGMGIQLMNASINTTTSLIYDTWIKINQTASISQAQLQQTATNASSMFKAQLQQAIDSSNMLQAQLQQTINNASNTFKAQLQQTTDVSNTLKAQLQQTVTNASNALTVDLARFNTTVDKRLIQHSLVAQHYGVAAVCSKLLPVTNTRGSNIYTVPVDPTSMTRTCADYCGSTSCVGAVAQTTDPSAAAVMSPPMSMNPSSTDPARSLSRASSWSVVAPSSSCSTPTMSLWGGPSRAGPWPSTVPPPRVLRNSRNLGRHCGYVSSATVFQFPNDFRADTMMATIDFQYNFTTYCPCQLSGSCSPSSCIYNNLRSSLWVYIGNLELSFQLWSWNGIDVPPVDVLRIAWEDIDSQLQTMQPAQYDGQLVLNQYTTGNKPESACYDNVKTTITFTYQDKLPQAPQDQRYCCCTNTVGDIIV